MEKVCIVPQFDVMQMLRMSEQKQVKVENSVVLNRRRAYIKSQLLKSLSRKKKTEIKKRARSHQFFKKLFSHKKTASMYEVSMLAGYTIQASPHQKGDA